jgi:hypothetical protein
MSDNGKRDLKFLAIAVFGLVIGIAVILYSLGWRP